jgi:hypothetical protein
MAIKEGRSLKNISHRNELFRSLKECIKLEGSKM